MIVRRILVAVGLAASLGLWATNDASAGVTIGGGKSDSKGGGCHGIFCIQIDPTTIKKKLTPAAAPATANTTVCISKFKDTNGNGVRDWNEIPLGGFDFIFTGPFGTSSTLTTGPGGGTCFTTQFPAGIYTATELPQSGWTATTPGGATQTFTIVPGQNVNLTFGNRPVVTQPSGTVCVTKYNDLSGNGIRDGGEPALSGWLFSVKTGGTMIDFGTTNAQGVFCTTHPVPAGSTTVYETMQSGWDSTDPGGAIPTKTVTITAGQTTNVVFGNRIPPPPQPLGQICVNKYEDVDSNGTYSVNEPLLAGWQFTITGPSGPLTLTTGPSGGACTSVNLILGSYVVTETMLAGWSNTSPGGLSPHRNVTVAAGPSSGNLMFGNMHAAPNQICVLKYQDLNKNGHYDAGEPPLAGWTFDVLNASNNVVASGVTGSDGRYCTMSNLSPATYSVTETQKPGWVSTDPPGPPMKSPPWVKSVTLPAARGSIIRFGNIKSGQLCVTKYNDVNGNGIHDPGEPTMSDWTFHTHYTNWSASPESTVTTDISGTGCIDLPPGPNQELHEVAQSGWTSTDPVASMSIGHLWAHKEYAIVEGQTTSVSIGNHQDNSAPGHVCVVKYNDTNHNGTRDTGEWLLNGWHIVIKTISGTTRGTLITSATAPGCMDLPVGSYSATEVMQMGWKNSDPTGTNPQKLFTVASGQTVNLSFGNFQLALP